jgi:hypothetical protein
LSSHALAGGSAAIGPNDISFHRRGGAYRTLGLGFDQRLRDALGPGSRLVTDAVPTAVVKGPDGPYYVSELSGVPFATNHGITPGIGEVLRISR